MKKCNYCGRDNADDATACTACGMADFETPAVGTPEHTSSQALLRLFVAGGIGLTVLLLSLFVAWQNMRSEFSMEQRITRMILRKIDSTTKDLQRTNHHALSIDEVRTELGEFSDAWRQPLIYTNQGTNVVAISYGRDGKPGGNGLDSDLSSLDPSPKESLITFHQFYFELATGKIVAACIICAAMASAISLLTVRRIDLTIPGLVRTALILLATGFAALMTALTISALHIPSGH